MDEAFKIHLLGLGLSSPSVRVYLHAVSLYFDLYPDVGQVQLLEFREHLISTYKAQTVNLYIIGINKYLAFIGKDRWRLHNLKIQQTYLDNVITHEQYLQLKECLKRDGNQKWLLIVWTLAATGVRVSELVRIRVEHAQKGYLDLCSKGNKLRRIYIPQKLQLSLLAWCETRQYQTGLLFRNRHGSAISIRGIAKGLEHIARRYGIDPKLTHPHAFRHLYAKNFLKHCSDMALLADLLGHKSLETTKIYLRYTMQEQRDKVNQVVDW